MTTDHACFHKHAAHKAPYGISAAIPSKRSTCPAKLRLCRQQFDSTELPVRQLCKNRKGIRIPAGIRAKDWGGKQGNKP
ncbi:hypothetical protein Tdes44962_MAKER06435 [Teratosphaeria destructans]|uniref:Uncharacterized protein n=1 Tax=Teratosphaeria destructans TaxID=418781 RepID=A0A9W7W7W6_9PEZI|nr:hypothetical protein Tdes44962_MAKER06435 [Teratosphaeria destructans]